MASKLVYGFLHDDSKLHRLCHDGNYRKVTDFVNNIGDRNELVYRLTNCKGVFGYSPIHEAVAGGHDRILDFLLQKAGEAHVNCLANGGYTPLHLAASRGQSACVRVLLKYDADLHATDEYGKTPKQRAELSSKSSTVRILRSAEIIKEVQTNGDGLTNLLRSGTDQLEPYCLDAALMAAVENDNHCNIGKLIVKGASDVKHALKKSVDENKPHARAMLLMVIAAMEGNCSLVLRVFGEPTSGADGLGDYINDPSPDVQRVVQSGKVSTIVPIEIARRCGQTAVREELLLKTDVNEQERTVHWHGLRLLVLDINWLRRIHWVQKLRLARNGLKTLPNEFYLYLKKVVKLDLQHNELRQIPPALMELPNLQELHLSFNQLQQIPDVPEWSPGLSVLELSHNQLQTLPLHVVAGAIRNLNLSFNRFRSVPLCICSLTTLHTLDLSDNPDIRKLPFEMGRLVNLNRLHLRNLKNLSGPVRLMQQDTRECISYLYSKLRNTKPFYQMKLMIIGCANQGKTTLAARLQGKECNNEPTVGINVSEWQFRPGLRRKLFHFNIWDFGGKKEYYATYQCFLTRQSLYLLVFNLKMGEEGVKELRPWLNNIAFRAPKSCVIIVGTHLDEVKDEKRDEVFRLLNMVGELAGKYNNLLNIVEIIPVGSKNRLEHIGTLKDAIYNHAANYMYRSQAIMGQMVPASYHALNKQLQLMQHEVHSGTREPIMHAEEFKLMVSEMNLLDIQSNDELKTAALFLTDVGTLLHFDDYSHNLNQLYFIDPCWLFDTMAKFVTIKERNPLVNKGILLCEHIPHFFRDMKFPWQYFEQFLILLDRFEIAVPLDNRRILIPSMLPNIRPKNVGIEDGHDTPFYSRCVLLDSAERPPGFWSRLLSHIIHFIPKVYSVLDKTLNQNISESTDSFGFGVDLSARLPPAACMTSSSGVSLTSFPASNNLQSISQLFTGLPSHPPQNTNLALYDIDSVHVDFWKLGLVYEDPDVSFSIETLPELDKKRDGVLICVSMNREGKKVMCQLVDIVVDLVNQWYPGLAGTSSSLLQKVPCYECLKLQRPDTFKFNVELCLPAILQGHGEVECGYSKDPQVPNHMVALQDIVPDLLMHDIDERFHLRSDDIVFKEEDSSLLGVGGFGKAYQGKYLDKPVAIKRSLTMTTTAAFANLHSEAKFLEKYNHPCIVCLVGVCLHPYMALVLEEAPLGSLQKPLLRKKIPIHRVTIFKIASQVAAGLRFLHSNGIIFRDLCAANILLWTLDHKSLCHCKITNFECATHLTPVGARGLQSTKGFVAPEVLYVGKRKQRSVYNHTADIFSFSMLLYQMIARRDPYYNIKPEHIDTAIESGRRPKLQDVDNATVAFYYLTKLMKACWSQNPPDRPSTEVILQYLCSSVVQSIMSVNPMKGHLAVRKACAIPPHQFTEAQSHWDTSELWICFDGKDGTTINIYSTNTMLKTNSIFIKGTQIQCICLCKDYIWVGSNVSQEYSTIDIFNAASKNLVHNIRMRDKSVSCITCSDTHVFLGTLEGYFFSFSIDIKQVQANAKPKFKHVSDHALQGIVVTGYAGNEFVWISHTRYIHILKSEDLALDSSLCQRHTDAFIGQLSVSPMDGTTVWSAHIGGKMLSAWDATHKVHKFTIDTVAHVKGINPSIKDSDIVITAMTPALDTAWVGMTSGHILVFADNAMLTWYHPYSDSVSVITAIPCSGPCKKEECMIITGAKGFRSPLPPHNPVQREEGIPKPDDGCGALILWEAFDAKMTQQMKLIEEKTPHLFNNHDSIKEMIRMPGLQFKDGTQLMNEKDGTVLPVTETNDQCCPTDVAQSDDPLLAEAGLVQHETESSHIDPSSIFTHFPATVSSSIKPVLSPPDSTNQCDIFHINIAAFSGEDEIVRLSCPSPAQLDVLLNELEKNGNIPREKCRVEYYDNVTMKQINITSQSKLDVYRTLSNRPQLFLSK